jgi:anaphase-promoting complex subunit 6
MMDPHFGPAWIGFAHSFAAEGEHEQAISAYTTAARLFQGYTSPPFFPIHQLDVILMDRTHLPLLFLGMQHLQLNNLQLAEEYLLQAHGICDNDPLLLNEIGVAAFEKGRYTEAVHYFKEAIRVAEQGEWDQEAWTIAWTNLGHAYRKMGYPHYPCSWRLTMADN